MVYYRVILDDRRPKADGIYPVIVRVIHNRKNTSLATGERVQKAHWQIEAGLVNSSHPNFQLLNKSISEFYLKVQKAVLQLESEHNFTFEALKERLLASSEPLRNTKTAYFNDYAKHLIDGMFAINKTGNAIVYKTTTNRLMAFANRPKLKFTEIDYTFLEAFKDKLTIDGVKQNTISNYFRTLRAIYNKAIKAKLVDRSHYPFLDITIKTERTAKRAIGIDQLLKIYNLSPKPKTPQWHARNYFLLSFSLIGASFTDLAYLKHSNIRHGRLIYKRRKTGKELNIKLVPLTIQLLELYKGSNQEYLLPAVPLNVQENSLQAKKHILQWIKTTNKWLGRIARDCGIEEEVTTYVARHTWATSAKRLGYSNELIAESMGHEYGNKITNIYLDSFDQRVVDELNERVIGLLTT